MTPPAALDAGSGNGRGLVSWAAIRSACVNDTTVAALLGVLVTVAWTFVAGKDLSTDVLNHHVYLPFSLVTGRYTTDLFAAGPQSYQNPLGYLPFVAMIQAGWPAWIIGMVLGAVHGLVLAPLSVIARTTWGTDASKRWWRWLAIAFAWTSPVFLAFAGTSSVDPTCHLLVLTALAVTLIPGSGLLKSALGGLALGVSFAIKPTNAVFVLALGAVMGLRLGTGQLRWRQAGVLLGSALAGALVTMWFWSQWLWTTFGNPVFPLFNQHFASPFAPQQAIMALRFLPESAADWFSRPWEMAELRKFTSTELFVPDLRPAALVVASVLAALALLLRRQAPNWRSPAASLCVFTVVASVFWMQSSGNARYAMPLLAVASMALVALARLALPEKVARVALATLLLLHGGNYLWQGDHRLAASDWNSGPYLQSEVPQRLRDEPYLHLSMGVITFAGLAPALHPEGGLINVVGQMTLPTEGPLGMALDERLQRWRGRTRFLFVHDGKEQGAQALSGPLRRRAERIIEHLPLTIDWSDCERIRVHLTFRADPVRVLLLSCAAMPSAGPSPARLAERQRADRTFASVERQCPRFYGPSPFVSGAGDQAWMRHYANSDIRVIINAQEDVLAVHFRSNHIVPLGKVDDVLSGRGFSPCEAWKLLKES